MPADTSPARPHRAAVGWRLPALLLALALLASAPAWLNPYWLRVLSAIFMIAVVAQGINLMAGYTGYPAFGNVVFFGVGAYVTGLLMVHAGWSFAPAALGATLAAVLLALAAGPPLLRLRGHYFAIATLGLNETLRELTANGGSLTGGGTGLSLPLPAGGPQFNAMRFYYLLFGVLLVATWVVHEFSRRDIGLGCRTIRDNEAKAEACGLHTTRYKTAAWMLSAAMTGAVGAIQAWWLTYIDPPSVFDLGIAVKGFVILLLGGAGTVFGPVVGAFAVEMFATLTWSNLLNWHLGSMGAIIIGVILLFPDGFGAAAGRGGWLGRGLAAGRSRLGARGGR